MIERRIKQLKKIVRERRSELPLERLKITMLDKTRVFLLTGISLGLVVMVIFLLGICLGQGIVENKVTKYQYWQKADLAYQVFLQPNLLYEEKVLGMGQIYPTNFVDQLKTTFTYEFSGDKKAEIKGNYSVVATVRGVQKEENKEKILWSKDFLLVPKTFFHSSEGTVKLRREVPLSLGTFNRFGEEVQKATEIVSNVILSLNYRIQLEAQNEEGLIKEEFTPSLSLPLCKKYFEISGDLTPEKAGSLEEVVQTKLPINGGKVAFLSLGVLLCILALVYLVRFVEVVSPNPWDKQIKQIFKKYGEKLVALEKEVPVVWEIIITIKSVDDLVRLADELCKPIYYYRRIIEGKESLSFYVFSDGKIFIYELESEEVVASSQ